MTQFVTMHTNFFKIGVFNYNFKFQIFDTLITINKEDDESIYNILDLFLDVLTDKQLEEIEDQLLISTDLKH